MDSGLAVRDGGLVFWIESGGVRHEAKADCTDGVQYISAGEWPHQTKWHVQARKRACVGVARTTRLPPRLRLRSGAADAPLRR